MPKELKFRGFNATQSNQFTGANREITVDTTNKSIRVHDGATPGGIESARADMANARLASASNPGAISPATFQALGAAIALSQNLADLTTRVTNTESDIQENQNQIASILDIAQLISLTHLTFTTRRLLNTGNTTILNTYIFDKILDSSLIVIWGVFVGLHTTGLKPQFIRYDLNGGPDDKYGFLGDVTTDAPFTHTDLLIYPSIDAGSRTLIPTAERYDGSDPTMVLNPIDSDVAGTFPAPVRSEIIVAEIGSL